MGDYGRDILEQKCIGKKKNILDYWKTSSFWLKLLM